MGVSSGSISGRVAPGRAGIRVQRQAELFGGGFAQVDQAAFERDFVLGLGIV